MPNVTITWYRNAGDENYLYGMPGGTIGPNGGSRTVSVPYGASYGLSASGSGPGSVAIRGSGTTLGLDDRQGAGADNDFNDMLVYVSAGYFSGARYYAPSPVYGCTDSNASNYNSNATIDDGSCVYPIPIPTLNANPTSYIRGGSSTLTWSVTNTSYANSITLNGDNVSATNPSGGLVVSPVTTTTYTLQVTYSGGSRTSSQTITVYQPPQITVYADSNPIPLGASTTLRWSTTGDASTLDIQPGIGSANLTSFTTISPTQSTVYVLTASGLGGVTSVEYPLTVWQPPVVDLNGPVSINFGESIDLVLTVQRATQSIELYVNKNIGTSQWELIESLTVQEYDNYVYTFIPPWSDFEQGNGIYEYPDFKLVAVGDGNLSNEDIHSLVIYIDRLPDYIQIPESDDKLKGEEPVITPDAEIVSEQIVINDIDVPVEIKADYPIQVEINNNAVWYDVRQI